MPLLLSGLGSWILRHPRKFYNTDTACQRCKTTQKVTRLPSDEAVLCLAQRTHHVDPDRADQPCGPGQSGPTLWTRTERTHPVDPDRADPPCGPRQSRPTLWNRTGRTHPVDPDRADPPCGPGESGPTLWTRTEQTHPVDPDRTDPPCGPGF